MPNGSFQSGAQATEPDRHDLLKRSVASASVALLAMALLAGSEFTSSAAASSVRTSGELAAVDSNFVAQANLGAPFRSIPERSPKRKPRPLKFATTRI
jgi:hypothetical protein